jgi:hypothetical protein
MNYLYPLWAPDVDRASLHLVEFATSLKMKVRLQHCEAPRPWLG